MIYGSCFAMAISMDHVQRNLSNLANLTWIQKLRVRDGELNFPSTPLPKLQLIAYSQGIVHWQNISLATTYPELNSIDFRSVQIDGSLPKGIPERL